MRNGVEKEKRHLEQCLRLKITHFSLGDLFFAAYKWASLSHREMLENKSSPVDTCVRPVKPSRPLASQPAMSTSAQTDQFVDFTTSVDPDRRII